MHLFCKTRTDYACKTSRLVRISLLISAITKTFGFFSGKLINFIKVIENFFLPTPLVFISGYANIHGKRFLMLKCVNIVNETSLSTAAPLRGRDGCTLYRAKLKEF